VSLRNSAHAWGSVSKALHWAMAAIILFASIYVLIINDSMPGFKSTPILFITGMHLHKTLGLLALVLIVLRAVWVFTQKRPELPATMSRQERIASKLAHYALYALMVAVPIFGWLSSSAFGSPTNVFGWFTVGGIWPRDRDMLPFFYYSHKYLAWTLLALVAVHVLAALWHHIIRKDGVLRAMLPKAFGRRERVVPTAQ
jgi:cytochrome b561